VDDSDAIVERVEQAVEVVGAERIALNPDGGFAPGSAARVDLDEVYQKLRYQTEAAKRLREIYA
jgi:methionine synthase II (cobalamin-independent)